MNNAEYLKNFKEINEDIQRVELTLKKDSDNPDLLNQLEELEKEKRNYSGKDLI